MSTALQAFGRTLARSVGWRVVVPETPPAKCVVIGAHHTSTWDLPLGMILNWGGNLNLRWMAKEQIFFFPLGVLLRAMGGIPVKRYARGNFVEQTVAAFNRTDALRLGLTPEGTRAYTDHWKTGFYYIALQAKVPIVMAFADFPTRVVGIGPTMTPTGDIEADFEIFRRFFSTITARYPERQGLVRPSKTATVPRPVEP